MLILHSFIGQYSRISWELTVDPLWISLQQVIMEVAVVTTGTLKRVQMTSTQFLSDHHHQCTNIQSFQGGLGLIVDPKDQKSNSHV